MSIMASPSVVHERKFIGVKIFYQIVDVSLDCGGASDVSDMSGVKPMHQMREASETCTRTTVPKFPLGVFKLADWMTAEVITRCAGAEAARRLQGVFETHGDMKPVCV